HGVTLAPIVVGQLTSPMLVAAMAVTSRRTTNPVHLGETGHQQRLAARQTFQTAGQHATHIGGMSTPAHDESPDMTKCISGNEPKIKVRRKSKLGKILTAATGEDQLTCATNRVRRNPILHS